ncbi:Peptide chain release factor 1 [Candidatus Arsenophonus lipoptenae]|uniref:Peptide chain release factor 1 n=1 Tax=Candidatus Arsenophonus lipoptenae TaxID=634113 RepID=A0A0X9VJ99_9GAMM|nr:peptide chain release factor 1 [Candidatus Arsenophonus lipoptenae]AMA65080.1 Peptide chain release factor 1 [Candidatus Arsenophonus lipoptenae]
MKSSIISKLKALQEHYEDIQTQLIDIKIITDHKKFIALSKEYTQLSNITRCFKSWLSIQQDIKTAKILLKDPEMHEMAMEELKKAKKYNQEFEKQLEILLLPKDPDDKKNCFLEIRAATGGDEAARFAGDLFKMYNSYAESRRWDIEIINAIEGYHGGYKEIITKINGDNVYSYLKFESGGHRVQRIPETESQGRIHTSTCTVAVLAEIPEIEISNININDLRIDTFRSSGAGGQHINTTDSAIRITHIPTGIVVECQDERSQHKNKSKALSVLAARIHTLEMQKYREAEAFERRNLLGSGERSDKIRTYNFPQGRVTDHRINLTLYRLNEVIAGKLDLLIQPIINEYQADQLSALSE